MMFIRALQADVVSWRTPTVTVRVIAVDAGFFLRYRRKMESGLKGPGDGPGSGVDPNSF